MTTLDDNDLAAIQVIINRLMDEKLKPIKKQVAELRKEINSLKIKGTISPRYDIAPLDTIGRKKYQS